MDELEGAGARWVENRPGRGSRRLDLRELWEHRDLVALLALRALRSRYRQAALGAAWAVVQPLAGVLVLVVVFRRLIDVPSDGVPYLLFALVGYALWSYVSGGVGALTTSLVAEPALVTKVYVPRLTVPLAAALPGLVNLGVALGVLAVAMALLAFVPPVSAPLLPVVVAFAVVVTLGAGLWLATFNVLYRDAGHALGFGLQLWFFASPVAYPSSLVEGGWRHLYALNPVAGLLDLGRGVVLGTPVSWVDLGISAAAALVVLAGGLACFQALERRFADVI